MTAHDFQRNGYDSCVYFIKCGDGSFIYILLYVDDMWIATKDKVEVGKVKTQLSEKSDMKDLGVAKILGLEILSDKKADRLYLSQKRYIEKILYRFNMLNEKAINSHLARHFKLSSAFYLQSD